MALKATFEILYARPKNEEACRRTLALFSDCKVREGKRSDPFDHACETRRHRTTNEALERMRDAIARAGDDVIDIQVSIKY